MQRIKDALLVALIAVAVCVGLWTVMFLDALTRTTAELPVTVDRAITREGALTRKAAERQIAATRKALVGEISPLRRAVEGMESDLADRAEIQIQNGLGTLDAQLTALNQNLDKRLEEVTATAGAAITTLSVPAQNTLNRVSETADLALDCDHNPDCVYNRYVGTARAIERTGVSFQKMADTIQQATPETSKSVKETSRNLSIIVQRFTKPANWISGVLSQAAKWAGKFLCF